MANALKNIVELLKICVCKYVHMCFYVKLEILIQFSTAYLFVARMECMASWT